MLGPGTWQGILAAALILGIFAAMFHHHVFVRLEKARHWLERGAVLLDVDTHGEFALHHPRVALSIPLEDLARRAHELHPPETLVVVFAHQLVARRASRAPAPRDGLLEPAERGGAAHQGEAEQGGDERREAPQERGAAGAGVSQKNEPMVVDLEDAERRGCPARYRPSSGPTRRAAAASPSWLFSWRPRVPGDILVREMQAETSAIDDYLASVSGDRRTALEKLRRTMRTIVPEAEECISYRIPAFRLGR